MLSSAGKQSIGVTGRQSSRGSDFASVCRSLSHRSSLTFTPFLSDFRGEVGTQNGRVSPTHRVRPRNGKGRGMEHAGKPRSWFSKTYSLVLQKQLLAFRKPTPWFPDLPRPPNRSLPDLRPFRPSHLPVLSDTSTPFLPDFRCVWVTTLG